MKLTTKQLKLIQFTILACVLFVVVFTIKYLYPQQAVTQTIQLNEQQEIKKVIEEYLLKNEYKSYYKSGDSKFFCNANLLWMNDVSETEKVVFAPSGCSYVKAVANDLVSESGGASPS